MLWCALVQVWSYSQFQDYLSRERSGQVPDDWVDTTLKVGGAGSLKPLLGTLVVPHSRVASVKGWGLSVCTCRNGCSQ